MSLLKQLLNSKKNNHEIDLVVSNEGLNDIKNKFLDKLLGKKKETSARGTVSHKFGIEEIHIPRDASEGNEFEVVSSGYYSYINSNEDPFFSFVNFIDNYEKYLDLARKSIDYIREVRILAEKYRQPLVDALIQDKRNEDENWTNGYKVFDEFIKSFSNLVKKSPMVKGLSSLPPTTLDFKSRKFKYKFKSAKEYSDKFNSIKGKLKDISKRSDEFNNIAVFADPVWQLTGVATGKILVSHLDDSSVYSGLYGALDDAHPDITKLFIGLSILKDADKLYAFFNKGFKLGHFIKASNESLVSLEAEGDGIQDGESTEPAEETEVETSDETTSPDDGENVDDKTNNDSSSDEDQDTASEEETPPLDNPDENKQQILAYLEPLIGPDTKELTLFNAGEVNRPLYHISMNPKITSFQPRVSRRTLFTENRSIPRVSTSTSLIGCLNGYQSVFSDIENRAPKNFTGLYTVYNLPYQYAIKPSKKILADVEYSDEYWLVSWKPETFSIVPIACADLFIPKVESTYGSDGRTDLTIHMYVKVRTTLYLNHEIELQRGHYYIRLNHFDYQYPLAKNEKDIHIEEIDPNEYNKVASLSLVVGKIKR